MGLRFRVLGQWVFERAPAIILINIGFALFSAWTRLVPALVLYALATATALGAVAVYSIGFWREFASKEELGFRRNRDMLWYDAVGKGLPDDYYGLLIAIVLGALLTGLWMPALVVVGACALLSGAWAHAKRKWPGDPPNNAEN
jgi:hypothetical protein